MAVSKFQSKEAILEAYAAGQRVFGENYVQVKTMCRYLCLTALCRLIPAGGTRGSRTAAVPVTVAVVLDPWCTPRFAMLRGELCDTRAGIRDAERLKTKLPRCAT